MEESRTLLADVIVYAKDMQSTTEYSEVERRSSGLSEDRFLAIEAPGVIRARRA